jgi:NDP-sugar pyrophosphorylase family protein
VTLVCPTAVLEAIRSWKSDVCKRKIGITYHPFADSLDTAELLFRFKDTVRDDFVVIVGSVLFDAEAVLSSLSCHRAKEPVVTIAMQQSSDINTPAVSLKKSMSDLRYPANFVGYGDDHRLIYIRTNSSIVASLSSSNVSIKKSVLKRFPNMRISTSFFDGQLYVFSKNALQLADEKRRSLTSIRLHLVPFLVRSQFRAASVAAEPSVQALAHSMSSSWKRLTPELRCFISLIPPSVFLCRIESLEDFIHVSRLVSGESVKAVVPRGVRSEIKKTVLFVESGAVIHEKAMIGTGCIIGEGSVIEGPCSAKKTTLGRHSRVAANVKIQTSITMDHVTISEGAVVKNSVIGSNVIIESNCVVENAIIGYGFKTEKGKRYADGTFNSN